MNFSDFLEKGINKLFAMLPRKTPAAEQAARVRVIAHRGAHDHNQGILENTMPAFQRALEYGCWGCEFDVRFTKDGEPVVHHDASLHRLFKRPEFIHELSVHELKKLVPEIPTLKEVIECIGRQMVLFIELKTSIKNEARLKELLADLTAERDFFLISLNENILSGLRIFPKSCQLLVPTQHNTARFCRKCIKRGFAGVVGHFLLLTTKKIQMLKKAKKYYGVGFVESRRALYRELNRNMPWIFTNSVTKIMQHLEDLKNNQAKQIGSRD